MNSNNRSLLDIEQIFLPGLGGSTDTHWQSIWQKKSKKCQVVLQDNWEAPEKIDWVLRLDAKIRTLNNEYVIVGHSLGCALAAHWVTTNLAQINEGQRKLLKGVMMVAPADVDSAKYTPNVVRPFAPMPTVSLPCKSIVVASSNDPYVTIERAREFARNWKSSFFECGACGHLNGDSGLGEWSEGQALLQSILQ